MTTAPHMPAIHFHFSPGICRACGGQPACPRCGGAGQEPERLTRFHISVREDRLAALEQLLVAFDAGEEMERVDLFPYRASRDGILGQISLVRDRIEELRTHLPRKRRKR